MENAMTGLTVYSKAGGQYGIGEVIYNCSQPHGAWSILGQPLAAFAHHASILQANPGCKLCINTTSSNDGLIP